MTKSSLRTLPIRRVGTQANLFLGGDRELVLSTALLCLVLAFLGFSLWTATVSILLWMPIIFLLRRMAKADPMMRHVYTRHRIYSGYYPARATPWRNNTYLQGRQYK